MKLFRIVLKHLEVMGIYTMHTHQAHRFNAKILLFSLSMAMMLLSYLAYCLFESTSIMDYGNSFFGFIAEISNLVDFLITIWRLPLILKLIDDLEKFIGKSKPRIWLNSCSMCSSQRCFFLLVKIGLENESSLWSPYMKLEEKIEQMSKWINYGFMYVSFGGVALPPVLTTLTNYFVHDMGNESYEYVELMYVKWISNGKKFRNVSVLYPRFTLNFIQFRLPINRNSLLGYVIFEIFETVGYFCTIYAAVPTIGLYVGVCCLFIHFINDIRENVLNGIRDAKNSSGTPESEVQVKVRFCHMVELYSDVKQLSASVKSILS